MSFLKIWNLYLLKSLMKMFFFLLLAIFFIYTIVDLSMNGVRFFSHGHFTFLEITKYYLFNFSNLHAFFFPLTFLLASLLVFLDLNKHHEIVALQMAGLSQKKLLTPFFVFATLLVIASYAHQEWLAPTTQIAAIGFRSQHSKHKKKNTPYLHNIALQDQSELVYQKFENDGLFDVFWLKNNQDIWHMKYLKMNPTRGLFADHFYRNALGELEKTESFTEILLPQIAFDPNVRLENFIPLEQRPLSTLIAQAFKNNSEKKNVVCHLHYTIAAPLVCFLLLFAISPFVFRFSRSKNAFLITALSLFAYIAFRTIFDGMLILGENQVIPSYFAIWSTIVVVLAISLPRFVKS
ncbi:MAG TPA: LptF/LptG family permease [Chlamydiales bacterium]|nr:LptF/LptG family permease [Chlamydiales bacterium]